MNSNPEQQSAHYSDEASQQESGDYDEVKVNIKKIELIAKQCDRVIFKVIVTLILFTIVGNIVTSQSTNVACFCGGTAIYQIGLSGMQLCAEFIAMDHSNFNWRLFCASVPNIGVVITTWVSGNITPELGQWWGWGIGMWAFILPLSCLTLLSVLLYFDWRARCSSQWMELNQKYNAYSKIEYRDVSVVIDMDSICKVVSQTQHH